LGLSSQGRIQLSQIGRGYLSPYSINNLDKQITLPENPYVLLHAKISNIRDLLPVLQRVAKLVGGVALPRAHGAAECGLGRRPDAHHRLHRWPSWSKTNRPAAVACPAVWAGMEM